MSRCKYKNKLKTLSTHVTRTTYHSPSAYNEIPLCTCSRRASLTVEAAVVFPFVAAFWACILLFFRVLQVQTDTQIALSYAARKCAVLSSTLDNTFATVIAAKGYWKGNLSNKEYLNEYVDGGISSVNFWTSTMTEDEICLRASYSIRIQFGLFPKLKYPVMQCHISHRWTGQQDIGQEEDPYVYITEYGEVYHTSNECTYLDLSIKSVNFAEIEGLRNANEHKYYPCQCCVAENSLPGTVFITDYGEHYHTNVECPALRRTVRMVHLSEVGGRKCCKKCASKAQKTEDK